MNNQRSEAKKILLLTTPIIALFYAGWYLQKTEEIRKDLIGTWIAYNDGCTFTATYGVDGTYRLVFKVLNRPGVILNQAPLIREGNYSVSLNKIYWYGFPDTDYKGMTQRTHNKGKIDKIDGKALIITSYPDPFNPNKPDRSVWRRKTK